jgi:hypothetical protein
LLGDQRHAPDRFTPGNDPVPIVQEAEWASGQVWTGMENLAPTGFRSPDRPGWNFDNIALYNKRSVSHYTPHFFSNFFYYFSSLFSSFRLEGVKISSELLKCHHIPSTPQLFQKYPQQTWQTHSLPRKKPLQLWRLFTMSVSIRNKTAVPQERGSAVPMPPLRFTGRHITTRQLVPRYSQGKIRNGYTFLQRKACSLPPGFIGIHMLHSIINVCLLQGFRIMRLQKS